VSEFSDEEKGLLKELSDLYALPRHNQFLSWDVVEKSSGRVALRNKPLTELYPVIFYKTPSFFDFSRAPKDPKNPNFLYDYYVAQPDKEKPYFRLVNILYEPRWMGFGIESSRAITTHLPELAINLKSFDRYFTTPKEIKGGGVLINGQLACLGAYGQPSVIFDLEKALVFNIQF